MGRDIQAVKISGEDRRKYRDKVQRSLDVFARMLREQLFQDDPAQVGVEIELNLVDDAGAPSMRNAAVLDAIADPAWDTELGQFNLEINVPPRPLAGAATAELEAEIRASLNAADSKARQAGSRLVMVGILPTLGEQDVHEGTLSANERYKVLNEQIFAARGEDLRIAIDGPEPLLTHAGSITPEAACTSVQLHVQVSPAAFASYWNAAQAIAGAQVALAANSPYLFGRQLWQETRIILFEQATDTRPDELKTQGVRPRVWFGERWITSVFDLFEENLRYFPALLPICEDDDPEATLDGGECPQLAEMNLHNGTIYRWNRPVYAAAGGRPHLRVENRVLPAWPDRGRRAGQRRVLLRAGPRAGRGAATGLDADVVRHRGREPAGGGPQRAGRPAVLARPGRSARRGTGAPPPAAAGPFRAVPLGRQPGARRPAARHRSAALPDRADRRRLAGGLGRHVRRAGRGPGRGAAADDPALHRAHAHQRPGAHLAAPLTWPLRGGKYTGKRPSSRMSRVAICS